MPRNQNPRDKILRMQIRIAVLLTALVPVALLAAARAPSPAAPASTDGIRQLGDKSMAQLMEGDLATAIAISRRIQSNDPSSPLGYLLEADAAWWKIYYTTADVIDPDVFDVVSSTTTPYDSKFHNLIQTTIRKAKSRIAHRQDIARSTLYEGMAYALMGRLDGLRAEDMATARDGKKMRSLLLSALRLNPNLTDAKAGLGLYNYYVATLPGIVKMLGFLIGLPGGSRQLGLEQLTDAAEHGDLVRGEAKFYMAKNYTRRNEQQFGKALQLFQDLANEYPHNPFWELMVASVDMRTGKRQEGDALYRQIHAKTAGNPALVSKAVH
ncbi:MAG: hypothetical protein ACRD10_10625, partial [Terriglobia bacterium]